MEVLTKPEVIKGIAYANNLSQKQVKLVLDDLFLMIETELQVGTKIVFSGFGTFKTGKRKARMGRNPKLNRPMRLPEMVTIHFLPAKGLKKFVRRK